MNNDKGFTMVELLATITILGVISSIAIVAISSIITKAHEEYYNNQEKNLVLAAQAYYNANKTDLPKIIGKKSKITESELLEAKYLKEKIKNYDGKPCNKEPESFATVFKYAQSKYSYTAYLNCGSRSSIETKKEGSPYFEVDFPPDLADGKSYKEVKNAKVNISIMGNEAKKIKLMSYSYSLSYYNGTKYVEVYNSGNKESREVEVKKTVDLSKYTIKGDSRIRVKVSATNINGNTSTKIFFNNYKDEDEPKCIIQDYDNPNKDEGVKPWTRGPIKVTVGCDDGAGSGCVKNEYSKTFTAEGKTGEIKIKDNAGLSNKDDDCIVTTYIDYTTPTITLNLRSSASGDIIETFKIPGQKKEIEFYKEETYDTWLNLDDYPNGVFLDLKVTDSTSKIKKIFWKESKSYSNESSATNANKTILNKSNENKGSYTKKHKFTEDGYRLERIRVEDYAGNIVDYNLILKVDRTEPSCNVEDFSNECKNSGVSATVYCEDDISGVNSCASSSKGGEQSTFTKKTGIKKSTTYKVKDVANNSSSCKVTIYSDPQWSLVDCASCIRCSSAGCETYRSCVNPACGQEEKCTTKNGEKTCKMVDKKCKTKECGCSKYKADCHDCNGCKTWSSARSWKYTRQTCSNHLDCDVDEQDVYRYQKKSCSDGTEPMPSAKKYTLTYNDNGGSGCAGKSIIKNENESWGLLCTPARSGFIFAGWKDSNGNSITESTKATSNVIAIAQWSTSAIIPTISINNPTNGNWTKNKFSLTLSTNLSDEEVSYWYYSYANLDTNLSNVGSDHNTNWVKYTSSYASKVFETTKFSYDRNQPVYIMMCSVYGQCVKGSTMIRLDTTPPTLWGQVINTTGSTGCLNGYTYCTLYYTGRLGFEMFASDGDGSGLNAWGAIADYQRNGVGCNWTDNYNYTWQGNPVCSKNGTGNIKRCYKIKDNVGNISDRYCTCYNSIAKTVVRTSSPDSCW